MYRNGVFHLFWQAFLPCPQQANATCSIWWGHATSRDYVTWKILPPAFGGAAESGGAAQLPNGDVVMIFNEIGGRGHWQARPVNRSDPDLIKWTFTLPDGTPCRGKPDATIGAHMPPPPPGSPPCTATPGIPGTDLMGAFQDGSGDGVWRIVADGGEFGGGTASMALRESQDLSSWSVPNGTDGGVLHRYKWSRCVDPATKAQCGFHPYPCDPYLFPVGQSISDPDSNEAVFVVAGMQKTCADSGREFYALGRYDRATHAFALLDNRSDVANNLFDGGDGYASMTVYDPVKKRTIWHSAIIEGDRDPSSVKSGFWKGWLVDSGRGWFGILSLPRVIAVLNYTSLYLDGSTDVFLQSYPLPELSKLRIQDSHTSHPEGTIQPDFVSRVGFNGTSYEIQARWGLPAWAGWDFGMQILWSESGDSGGREHTRVGVMDGSEMAGVDLWDEVNPDLSVINDTASARACRGACETDPACAAWSHTQASTQSKPTGQCRLKAWAQHAVQAGMVGSSANCFLPFRNGTTSGYVQRPGGIRWAALYVDRAQTALVNTSCDYGDCSYGRFRFTQALRILPNETSIQLTAWVDKSVIEVFGQDGRASVTARVYPTLPDSQGVGLYARGGAVELQALSAWQMGAAMGN